MVVLVCPIFCPNMAVFSCIDFCIYRESKNQRQRAVKARIKDVKAKQSKFHADMTYRVFGLVLDKPAPRKNCVAIAFVLSLVGRSSSPS